MISIKRTVKLSTSLLVAIFLAIVPLLTAARPAHAEGLFKYIALGDSVASGHGLKPYGTGKGDKSCKRAAGTDMQTNFAYPHYIREFLHLTSPINLPYEDFHMLACSGAKAQDLAGQVKEANKLLGTNDDDEENDSPGIVSITIGANNFDFDGKSTYKMAFDPARYNDFVAFREKQAQIVRTELASAIEKLRGDNRKIVVTGYYNPFNTDSVIYNADWKAACDLPVLNRPTCGEIVADTVQVLNNAITGAVSDVAPGGPDDGVYLLDGDILELLFLLHRAPMPFCGDALPVVADSYIQSPSQPLNVNKWPKDGDDCFHPNQLGHEVIGESARSLLPFGS